MATARDPAAKFKAKGSHLKNPARYKNRVEPATLPLGEPSPHLNASSRVAWFAFASEIPWLAESDRAILEVACQVRGKLMAGEDLNAPLLTVLRQCLSSLGATPADRSRIMAAEEKDADDPTAVFFNA
jgi:hypothetical protein